MSKPSEPKRVREAFYTVKELTNLNYASPHQGYVFRMLRFTKNNRITEGFMDLEILKIIG
jgi:hypothetical protein